MTNREQMIGKARMAILNRRGPGKHPGATEDAAAVVDALLPQVTTVEELEALPSDAVVLNSGAGDVWARIPGTNLWSGAGCTDPDTSEHLIEWGSPLTVVWQP